MAANALLVMQGIGKRFGPVRALKEVDLCVNRGEVYALIGENGAGKSTLMKILSGALAPDSGTITLNGLPYRPRSPKEARRCGIAMMYQEPTLAPHLTVEENITLGLEKHTAGFLKSQRSGVAAALAGLGHGRIDPRKPVSSLGIGEKQIVEIARALMTNAALIIFDEPTSSLSSTDTQALFRAIKALTQKGIAVIYISHFLEEVRQIADRFSVLRDGASVAQGELANTPPAEIIRHMVGRPLTEMFPRIAHAAGEELLCVTQASLPPALTAASLTLHRGEILGIAGLVGAGRTELLQTIFGLQKAAGGAIYLRGAGTRPLWPASPRRSLEKGMDLLSENRKEEGLAINLSVKENITLASLFRFVGRYGILINEKDETAAVSARIAALDIHCKGPAQKVAELSGGNQQKAAIARILVDESDIILLDEPTRGIDVGSKAEIYRLIGALAAQGKGIVLVSSYLPELFGVCDTLAVMYRGVLSPIFPRDHWSEETVMQWATGGTDACILTKEILL
ncbi:MAG: sugar ABC transporter ATP-binding protein [Chitinivibrionales bacterium]|nr:sugar ABC transporter ATP-binding protein [Chitinivibrionales bacterium]